MYVYLKSEPGLYTVGYYVGEKWNPESDHDTKEEAAKRAAWLNGSNGVDINKLVNNFLCWRLPADFAPDCGIVFTPPSSKLSWPVGTNLLTASQAEDMIRHLFDN